MQGLQTRIMSVTPDLQADESGDNALLYEDFECSYMPHTWVPNSYSVPDHSQWELTVHSVQLTQRKHIYEDPIRTERVDVYHCTGTIQQPTGGDMVHWPTRLYRRVGPPLLLVVESMVESQLHMRISLDFLISGEKACVITVGKFLIITWRKMKRLVDEQCTLVMEWVWLLNLSVSSF